MAARAIFLRQYLKLVRVEFQQRAAMADADQHRLRQLVAQQLIHRVFQPFVHRRTGFVEENNFRTVEQHAADRQTLLLAERQDAAPVGFLIKSRQQMAELAALQDFASALVTRRQRRRVMQALAQAAQRQVGFLRQEQRFLADRPPHPPVEIRP